MSIKDWKSVTFNSSCSRTEQYDAFEKDAKASIKRQCKTYGINMHKFSTNHFEFSVVLERNGKFVYVRVGDVRWGDWYNGVLIRTMKHDKDWSGGSNNFCSFDKIGEKADKLFSCGTIIA